MNQSYSVKAYLDEDTKNLPANVTAARFIGGINTRLQTFDERLTLATATSYGAFPNYGGSQECLTNTFNVDVRFSFTYRPIRYRTCGYCVRSRTNRGEYPVEPYKENLSFLELKEDILRDVDQELQQANNQLSPILICTSDPDFRRLIGILRNDGYKVILFTNLDRDSPLLTKQERALVEAPQLYLHCNNCRKEPWIGVLYAPWCQDELADKLAVAKFRADGDQKEFAQQELKLGSIPTVLVFPKNSSRPIKYPPEERDVVLESCPIK